MTLNLAETSFVKSQPSVPYGANLLFLVFPYFFVFVPCARLSWPSRQLLSTCNYTVSYRLDSYNSLWEK